MGDPPPDLSLSPDATLIGHYAFRLPKGYVKSSVSASDFGDVEDISDAKAWAGPPRSDGSRPFIALTFITQHRPTTKVLSANDVLWSVLLHQRKGRTDWSQTQTEPVKINGIPYVYATWRAKTTSGSPAVRGFVYVAAGDPFVCVFSEDTEPCANDSLAKATASAMTLRKIN